MPSSSLLRWVAHFALGLLVLAPFAAAQTTPVANPPRLWIVKQSSVRQTSPTAAVEESSAFSAIVTIPGSDDIVVTVRGPGGSFEAAKTALGFEYGRPFDTAEAMDQMYPDGAYTIISSKGSFTVNVSSAPSPVPARITNWDALQRWNGRDQLTATFAPTTAGLAYDPTALPEAAFSVLDGIAAVIQGGGNLTAPATSITTSTHELRIPTTTSGQKFAGQVVFTLLRGSNSIITPNFVVTRKHTLKFDVARAHSAPQITQQPVGKTVNAGEPLTLAVSAVGAELTYLWLRNSVALPTATNATLTIASARTSDAGLYTAVVSNTGGAVLSAAVPVVVNATAPVIASSPAAATLTVGDTHRFSVALNGPGPYTYQWFRDGVALAGATQATLALTNVRLTDAGSYTVTVRNDSGSITTAPAVLTIHPVTRLSNLSIRTRVGGGNGALLLGLTVGGSAAGTKPLLLRAVGPTLGAFGVDDALADPRVALLSGENVISQNDDWNGSATIAAATSAAGAFALVSDASKDAALLSALASGSYTLRIEPASGNGGIALAEVYDATSADAFTSTTPRLINLSALAPAGSGGDTLIVGFTIAGTAPKRVLVRGIGPALAAFGVSAALADPRLEIYRAGSDAAIDTNDDWSSRSTATDTASAAGRVGAFPLTAGSRDAALLLTLPPGSYTAQISGAGATGSALVELYEVP